MICRPLRSGTWLRNCARRGSYRWPRLWRGSRTPAAMCLVESKHPMHQNIVRRIKYEILLTAERLREFIHYDPLTGVFTWLVLPVCRGPRFVGRGPNQVRVGGIAGCVSKSNGYRRIKIGGHPYCAHRLAWLYMTGTWPKDEIDHINRVRSDNRFCN